jgi:predicted metal-binding protein
MARVQMKKVQVTYCTLCRSRHIDGDRSPRPTTPGVEVLVHADNDEEELTSWNSECINLCQHCLSKILKLNEIIVKNNLTQATMESPDHVRFISPAPEPIEKAEE